MNKTLEEIKDRLVRGESIEFISIHTWVDKESIKRAFNLK